MIPGTVLDIVLQTAGDHGEVAVGAFVTVADETQSVSLKGSEAGMQAQLTVLENTRLAVNVIDQYGIPADPPFIVNIGTVPDRKPLAALTGVRRNEKITLQAVLPLQAEARDDYGLDSVEVTAVVRKQIAPGANAAPEETAPRIIAQAPLGQDSARLNTIFHLPLLMWQMLVISFC